MRVGIKGASETFLLRFTRRVCGRFTRLWRALWLWPLLISDLCFCAGFCILTPVSFLKNDLNGLNGPWALNDFYDLNAFNGSKVRDTFQTYQRP